MATVWYEGIEEDLYQLAADLKASSPKAKALAAAALNKTLAAIELDAKNAAPVDTGNLKNSISRTKATAQDLSGEVGPTASYGGYLEFGTEHMDPQPYLGPAFDQHLPAFEAALVAIAAAAI